MVFVSGAVYEPPSPGFPHILVFFDADGDIRVARPVESAEAGRALLEKMTEAIAQFGLAELDPDQHADRTADPAEIRD
jgi:hypothetical protein